MATNRLSALEIKEALPRSSAYSLSDGASLFLCVEPNGSKLWRYRFRLDGRPNRFAIGVYPEVTLKQARDLLRDARSLVKQGINPSVQRKASVTQRTVDDANTFEVVATEWMAHNPHWSSNYADQVQRTLTKDVFPSLGRMPIALVEVEHIRPVIKEVSERKTRLKKRGPGAKSVAILIRQWCSQIFVYAKQNGYRAGNPAIELRGFVKKPRVRHNPHLSWDEIGTLLKAVEQWNGFRTTVIALNLMALTFVRTVELRRARWLDFDLTASIWTIPIGDMKMGQTHIVPLSSQAAFLLRELHTHTGSGAHLFPNHRRPQEVMSATTINAALARLGFQGRFSGHGFRSTATTLLGLLAYPDSRVDLQLAHTKSKDSSRAPYDHTNFISSRKVMMQDWADILWALKDGASQTEIYEVFGVLSARRKAFLAVQERECI